MAAEATEAVLNPTETQTPPVQPVVEASKPETQPKNDIAEKQAAWDAKKAEIDGLADIKGYKIDEGIRDTVVAFNMSGFNTTGSCEGHNDPDHGGLTPYIDIAAPNQPKTRYVDEVAAYQRIADKYGIPLEKVSYENNINGEFTAIIDEAVDEASKNGSTAEFKAWAAESDKLGHQLEPLVAQFYVGRNTSEDIKLHAAFGTVGTWRIDAGSYEEHHAALAAKISRTPEQAQEQLPLLLARRAEMLAFTDFLKNRYFAETNTLTQPTDESNMVQLPPAEVQNNDMPQELAA